jgi:hypothetical protein
MENVTFAQIDLNAIFREIEKLDFVEKLCPDFDRNDGSADLFRLSIFSADADDRDVDIFETSGANNDAAVRGDAENTVVVVFHEIL